MYSFHMDSQITPLNAPVVTVRAFKRLLSGVDQLVVLQFRVFNSFATVFAIHPSELFTRMRGLVFLQVLRGVQHFSAESASILFPQLVHHILVCSQADFIPEFFEADVAILLWSVRLMAGHVSSKPHLLVCSVSTDAAMIRQFFWVFDFKVFLQGYTSWDKRTAYSARDQIRFLGWFLIQFLDNILYTDAVYLQQMVAML